MEVNQKSHFAKSAMFCMGDQMWWNETKQKTPQDETKQNKIK